MCNPEWVSRLVPRNIKSSLLIRGVILTIKRKNLILDYNPKTGSLILFNI
jgi:hypothetical protein